MSKKKKKHNGTKNQQNQFVQTKETTTQHVQDEARSNMQTSADREVCTNTDCAYYRKGKPFCALGVAPTHCDACNAYITLQIIKKKKKNEED